MVENFETDEEGSSWGEWVEDRARFVGYPSLKEFANAVDVSERQIARWVKRGPKPNLHPSNFTALARALKLGEDTLREGWKYRIPKQVEVYNIVIEAKVAEQNDDAMRREINGIAMAIQEEHLYELHRTAKSLLAKWLSQSPIDENKVVIPPDPVLEIRRKDALESSRRYQEANNRLKKALRIAAKPASSVHGLEEACDLPGGQGGPQGSGGKKKGAK